MISKRNKRYDSPQENLRQFSLNNSKGIDSTKSPTDFNTVSAAKNLVVNPDGSMSLRKPLTYVDGTLRDRDVLQYYLYDGYSKLEVLVTQSFSSIGITGMDGTYQPIRVKCTTADGTVLTRPPTHSVDNLIFPQGTPEVVNLNSTTIVGNCTVDLKNFDGKANDGVDFSLYDSVKPLPRYLQIRYAENDKVWDVTVKSPEVNTLTTAEGEIPLNPNLNLDNPTAVRDTYDAVVPTVKGIVAYAPSTITNGIPVVSELTHASTSDSVEQVERVYSDRYGAPDPQTNLVTFESTSTIRETLEFSDEFNDYDFECGLSLGLKLESGDPAVYSVHLDSTCTIISEYVDEDDDNSVRNNTISVNGVFDAVYSSDVLSNEVTRHLSFKGKLKEFKGWRLRYPDGKITFEIKITYTKTSLSTGLIPTNVITENVRNSRFRIVNAIENATKSAVILKAFCSIPVPENTTYYATWFSSTDGIEWTEMRKGGITVKELSPTWVPDPYDKDAKPKVSDYVEYNYFPFVAEGFKDSAIGLTHSSDGQYDWLIDRTDVIGINTPGTPLPKLQYRFKIIAVEPLSEGMPEWESSADKGKYRVYATVAQQDYTPVFKDEFEFFDIELGNTAYGKKMYHRKALYSYGHAKFFNNIFVSDIDSFITPLYNVIDLDARESSQVTCIVPWRDYLVSATDNAVYLHTKQADGFLTKTVNTSIGIPAEDYACCKAVLNGILFKSGPKIYQLYPNVYSGDDSTLNVTDISKPVEDILEEYLSGDYLPFAFSTESEYILMLPNAADTTCLRYDYSSKRWAVCTYPVVATRCEIISLNDIRIFGIVGKFSAEFVFDSTTPEGVYGDTLPVQKGSVVNTITVPIEFEWDTGQKTDNISIQKQFVESKLVFSTEDALEYFPMELTVHVDGDPHVTSLDLNSDAPFWKDDGSIGVANTAFRLSSGATSGVFRQLIVRYSGKGRSVRHILSGKPTSNFRLYETYVRYKTLNVKR